jgi:acetyl-CoA synthetase
MHEVDKFLAARQFLLDHREDYEAAYAGFRWPELERFNWATDWFDRYAEGNTRSALAIAEVDGSITTLGFDELARRSNQVANCFRRLGVGTGDPVLLMLDNVPALWEALLALMKLGAIVVPTTTLMTAEGIAFRVRHAGIRHVVTASEFTSRYAAIEGMTSRVAVGAPVAGWTRWDDVYAASAEAPPAPGTRADDPFLYYS